jgi:hypothetical protein
MDATQYAEKRHDWLLRQRVQHIIDNAFFGLNYAEAAKRLALANTPKPVIERLLKQLVDVRCGLQVADMDIDGVIQL